MINKVQMKDIVNLAKNRWFVYAWSEIYGGLANSWDYWPYWSLLKENIKNLWIKEFVQKRTDMVLLDAAILMNPQTWVASGHVWGFSDPLIDDKNTKERFRADKLLEDLIDSLEGAENYLKEKYGVPNLVPESWSLELQTEVIKGEKVKNPNTVEAWDWTEAKQFNLMFKTFQWVTEDSASVVYLRPETAQGIFVDFPNILRTSRKKIPFWVAQVGKAFRNEITPGNFIFRTREFEQMEIEYFVTPWEDDEAFKLWYNNSEKFLTEVIWLNKEKVRFSPIKKEELPHYSKEAGDFEYEYPFGWGEIETLANRTDYDLTAHMKASKQNLSYFDAVNNKKFLPYVIEPAMGLGRITLAAICDAYTIDEENNRTYLKFEPRVAPIKVAVLPVVKKIWDLAKEIYSQVSEEFMCEYDEVGSIGKRYARMDEIWVPFCITIDSNNYDKWNVTIRHRDSMEQEIVKISELNEWLKSKLK